MVQESGNVADQHRVQRLEARVDQIMDAVKLVTSEHLLTKADDLARSSSSNPGRPNFQIQRSPC